VNLWTGLSLLRKLSAKGKKEVGFGSDLDNYLMLHKNTMKKAFCDLRATFLSAKTSFHGRGGVL
jgi:hypothetical protein